MDANVLHVIIRPLTISRGIFVYVQMYLFKEPIAVQKVMKCIGFTSYVMMMMMMNRSFKRVSLSPRGSANLFGAAFKGFQKEPARAVVVL